MNRIFAASKRRSLCLLRPATALGIPLLVAFALAWLACQRTDLPPNIVLITVDTLRADHLGSYGYFRDTSPAIDALGQQGIRFTQARSQSPWTLPSMASLHTSLYPTEHGAISAQTALSPGTKTVAEVLRKAGYQTIAAVSHIFVGRKYGFAQGFDIFDDSRTMGREAVTSEDLTKAALRYFTADSERPRFLWVHYFDPHFTYVRHPDFDFGGDGARSLGNRIDYEALEALTRSSKGNVPREALDQIVAAYDEEIAYTDFWIGKLIAGVREASKSRPTIFLFTADHGEYFHERGRFGHGKDLYDELIHVPLIVAGALDADVRARSIETPVEVASIATTIALLAGIETNPFQGTNLISVARGIKEPAFVYAEGSYAWGTGDRKHGVLSNGWKLIHRLDDNGFELYDLNTDPHETKDRFDTANQPAEAEPLFHALQQFERAGAQAGSRVDLEDDERARLKALGYVEE